MNQSIIDSALDDNMNGEHSHISHKNKSCDVDSLTSSYLSLVDVLELSRRLTHLSNFLLEYSSLYPCDSIAELQKHQFELIERLEAAISFMHHESIPSRALCLNQ